MQPLALAAEDSDVEQSWPGLFWLPPAIDEPGERDMLHLDDELAGLVAAADLSADQHVTHSAKPEPASPVPGESSVVHSKLAAALTVLCCAVLCCAVLCCAVLCCAVLCCAVLCCAVLCCAGLGWAGLGWVVSNCAGP